MQPNMSRAVLVALAAVASADLGERPLKRAEEVGFTGGWGSVKEARRLEMRKQAGWTWSFPGEPAAYAKRQEERKQEILGLEHYQERLDNWVQYTQTRSVPNFTKNGFDVVDIDPALHERLKTRLHAGLERARKEGEIQGIYGANGPTFVNHGERDLLKELLPTMEEWVPTVQGGLTPVTAYGMRAYHRGASLAFHADRVDTHIVSGILHVDHAYDDEAKPWPIEIEGHDGLRHSVALKPGQMLLYESAKCPHGRSSALEGDFYASVFVHFKPKDMARDWPYNQKDIWLAVPPGWDAKPLRSDDNPGERWAGAFLTTDMTEVAGMPPRAAVPKAARPLPAKVEKARNKGKAPAPSPANRQRAQTRKAAPAIDPALLKAAEAAAEAAADDDAPPLAKPSLPKVAPKTLDPALLEAAEAAAEAASDDPPPEEKPRGLLRPDEVDPGIRAAAEHRRGDSEVADDLDDAEAELAETEGDDGSNLEFADDAGRSATGRKLKGRSRRRIPSRTVKNKRGGPSRARSAVAKKLAENKKKRHLHRAAPQRTKVEHDANKQAHRDAGKDDDDDDDEDDDDDDEPEEDDDDDDDEVETIIGGGFVLAGLGYWIGGISALSACSIFIRRAIVTKGRSLKEVCGGKSKKDSDLPTFTPQK